MTTEIKFHDDEILFLLGESGMVGIVKAGEEKMLFLETPDGEIVQYLESHGLSHSRHRSSDYNPS